MKRLFLMIGAVACVALPLGDLAAAQGRGRDDRGPARAERQEGPSGRGRESRRSEERARPGRGYDRDDGPGRSGSRRDDRRGRWDGDDHRPGPQGRAQGRPRYEDGPPRAFAPQGARRGGYLPDRFRGGVVEDYRRYRLRPPPHGYAWVRVGAGFALVSEESGRVFDIVPD